MLSGYFTAPSPFPGTTKAIMGKQNWEIFMTINKNKND